MSDSYGSRTWVSDNTGTGPDDFQRQLEHLIRIVNAQKSVVSEQLSNDMSTYLGEEHVFWIGVKRMLEEANLMDELRERFATHATTQQSRT